MASAVGSQSPLVPVASQFGVWGSSLLRRSSALVRRESALRGFVSGSVLSWLLWSVASNQVWGFRSGFGDALGLWWDRFSVLLLLELSSVLSALGSGISDGSLISYLVCPGVP